MQVRGQRLRASTGSEAPCKYSVRGFVQVRGRRFRASTGSEAPCKYRVRDSVQVQRERLNSKKNIVYNIKMKSEDHYEKMCPLNLIFCLVSNYSYLY